MKELSFVIPYIFHVRGIPKRGTRERTEFGFETVSATVRIVPEEDAPIAAVFPVPIGNEHYTGEAGLVTLRVRGGRLYAKALSERCSETFDVTPEMLSTFLERGLYAVENAQRLARVLPDAPATIHRGLFPDQEAGTNLIRPFHEDKWQTWSSKDRVENRVKAEQIYNDLLVLGGVFWRVVPEPVYVLDHCHDHRGSYTSARITARTATERLSTDKIYGLTAWDRMISDAVDRYGIAPDESVRATVFIDDAFAYDDTIELFIENIARAIDHDGDLLKSFDIDSMTRWAGMRDAMELARSTNFAPPALDALASAAEHYAVGPKASKWAIDLIEKALAAQDRRSIDISLGNGFRV
ncbi:hypothetical protein GOB57_20955 [Sinorhizobium meliloti]|nr:hypothetical protein [Sinorhizobium meliloti]